MSPDTRTVLLLIILAGSLFLGGVISLAWRRGHPLPTAARCARCNRELAAGEYPYCPPCLEYYQDRDDPEPSP